MSTKSMSERLDELERGFARVLEHGYTPDDLEAELSGQAAAIEMLWGVQAWQIAASVLLALLLAALFLRGIV